VNSKISALTSATTPLAGTEVLPVVQSSATTQVTVANLTAGRAVSALSYTSTTGATFATTSGNVGIGTASPLSASKLDVVVNTATAAPTHLRTLDTSSGVQGGVALVGDMGGNANTAVYFRIGYGDAFVGTLDLVSNSIMRFFSGTSILERIRILTGGDVQITTGNIIPVTAAKGVNFTANTAQAGMTSQLLNWYEEGTFTPNQGAGLTLVGAFSSTGKYTRIGRQVSISGTVTGATSVAVTAAGVITTNLPFTVGTAGHGNATNVAINASAAVICTGTSVTSAAAIAATATITFSATYFV
jgi:hypothetical protein